MYVGCKFLNRSEWLLSMEWKALVPLSIPWIDQMEGCDSWIHQVCEPPLFLFSLQIKKKILGGFELVLQSAFHRISNAMDLLLALKTRNKYAAEGVDVLMYQNINFSKVEKNCRKYYV